MGEKKTLVSAFAWKFAERMLSQGVGLLLQIVIARMVLPETVGEMTILLSVITVFGALTQNGLSSYLIQKKELHGDDVFSVLVFGILVAVISMAVLWLCSEPLMAWLGYAQLGEYLKISGIILPFTAVNAVLTALLSRKMQFKAMFLRTLLVLPFSFAVCAAFLLRGFKLEALLAYNIANPFFTLLFLTGLTLKNRRDAKIHFKFDPKKAKAALPYSARIVLQDLSYNLSTALRSFVMGGLYTAGDLAYFDRAFTYTGYVQEGITYTASAVLLPAMAKEQESKTQMQAHILRATAVYSLLLSPLLLGFAAAAPTVIRLLLTENWLPCVPYIRIFAVSFLHYPILTVHRSAFLACGRSDVTLKAGLLQNGASVLAVLLAAKISPLMIAAAVGASYLIYIVYYTWKAKVHFGLTKRAQLGAVVRYVVPSAAMAVPVALLNGVSLPNFLKLCLQVFLGAAVYIGVLCVKKESVFLAICHRVFKKEDKK